NDIDSHGRRAEAVRRLDQLSEARARPGPAAKSLEAALVDIDDHRRKAGHRARHEALVGVEDEIACRAPKALSRGDMKQREKTEQHSGGAAPLPLAQASQRWPGPPAGG